MPTRSKPTNPLTVAILSLPESGTMAPYGLHEVLGEAGRGENAQRSLKPALVAAEAGPYETGSGLRVTPQRGLDGRTADIVIICDIHLDPGMSPEGRWQEEIGWVRQHIEADALVCSACSGAVLLAEAGLLDGAEAASHWIMADLFRDRYPAVKFRSERILCDSGRAGRLITTGGASSWQDLALYLIGRFCGAEEAARIARLFVIGDRRDGQLPFATMTRPRQHGNAAIADVQTWLADNYASPNPVTAMVLRSGMAERTFKRQFKAATGYAPVDYVQAMRIEEAKQMLETEPTAIEEIAVAVGYEDPTFFRKLFRRHVGVTPAQYRQRNRLRTLGD
ncbi:GlxA family transcriptional regulator [Shinella kummerowiae]|uniref:GlxA family transcriptional regulator n=1 Tax=Shinella kummerowiae TaxID=417745 RepID=UPI0021B58208|nr:helix-turn-helix domain-containing protein [Shinella kummerowiae]MCT7663192.1 helix-turn-helix domain-containing protein [Shinella kummerowiae]